MKTTIDLLKNTDICTQGFSFHFFNLSSDDKNNMNVKTGDKLALFGYHSSPYNFDPSVPKRMDGESYDEYIKRLIDSGCPYIIDIDMEYCKKDFDIVMIFFLESGKITINYRDYRTKEMVSASLREYNSIDRIFNGRLNKINNCWFLNFDS
jgi:hypothetical protein